MGAAEVVGAAVVAAVEPGGSAVGPSPSSPEHAARAASGRASGTPSANSRAGEVSARVKYSPSSFRCPLLPPDAIAALIADVRSSSLISTESELDRITLPSESASIDIAVMKLPPGSSRRPKRSLGASSPKP